MRHPSLPGLADRCEDHKNTSKSNVYGSNTVFQSKHLQCHTAQKHTSSSFLFVTITVDILYQNILSKIILIGSYQEFTQL